MVIAINKCIHIAEYIEQSTDGVRKMLSYALAIAVAISSFVLFLTAFFMSDIHRKDDFLWSGVGLFYALVLWFCARNITGAVLLGQASASILLVCFVWQTLKLRKAVAHPERAVAINNFSVLRAFNGLLKRSKKPATTATPLEEPADVVTESKIAIPQTTSAEAKSPASDRASSQTIDNKRGAFGKIFGNKKKATVTNTKLNEVLEEEVKTKTTTPQDKVVTPPTDLKGNLESKTDTVDESLVEKPESKDKQEPKTAANVSPSEQIKEKATPTEASKTIEDKTTDTSNVELPVETKPQTSIVEQPNMTDIVEDNSKPETEIVATETTVQPEVVTTETVKAEQPETLVEDIVKDDSEPETKTLTTETVESKANKSNFDSLETVEVAEVLEALPEDSSQKRNSDRSNIIEVTTTDIEEVTKAKQPESDSPADSKPDRQD